MILRCCQISKIFNIRITKECNRRCNYCTIKKFEGNAPLNRIIETIEYLQANNVEGIGLYGGEVLLHPDIDKILERFPNQLNIITNGDFKTDERMKLFKHIIVSVHDKIHKDIFNEYIDYFKVDKFLIVITHDNYKNIFEVYSKLTKEEQDKIRLIPYKNTDFDDNYLTDDDKKIIKGFSKSEYDLMNIPVIDCLKNVKITNLDLIDNTMAYCCISHYRTVITKDYINSAIINNINAICLDKQLEDCKLCTKRWEIE